MSWSLRSLGELTHKIGSGSTPRGGDAAYKAAGIPLVRSMNVHDGVFKQEGLAFIDEQQARLLQNVTLQNGDVLINITGASVARSCILPEKYSGGRVNQHVAIIRPTHELDPAFLNYFLTADDTKRKLLNTAGGGATREALTKAQLEALEIPLPPLDEQKRIAAILDKADQLRQKRRQAIALLDSLTQSIFLEMFGDPASNPKGWRQVRLSECCAMADDIKCGPFGTQLYQSDFRQNGVPLWGIKHVNKAFRLPTHEYVSEVKARELGPYNLIPGDLVMTRKGTIGNCALYPADFEPGIMHSDLLRVRLDSNLAAPRFMNAQLRLSNSVAHQLSLISGGAVMAGINVGKLKKISVLLPPLELQKEFDTALRGAELSGHYYEMSVIHIDSLFASLQHRAFSGQL